MPDEPSVPTPEIDLTPDTPKASWMWLKDSSGFPSVTVTFVTVAFWITTVLYILSAIQKIGPVQFREFDVAAASAYFVPILTLYFGRKWTDAKMGASPQVQQAIAQLATKILPNTPPTPPTPPGINPRVNGENP